MRAREICQGVREDKPLREGFLGAVVAMFVVKTIGMGVAIVFAAVDMVQFLGWVDYGSSSAS